MEYTQFFQITSSMILTSLFELAEFIFISEIQKWNSLKKIQTVNLNFVASVLAVSKNVNMKEKTKSFFYRLNVIFSIVTRALNDL